MTPEDKRAAIFMARNQFALARQVLHYIENDEPWHALIGSAVLLEAQQPLTVFLAHSVEGSPQPDKTPGEIRQEIASEVLLKSGFSIEDAEEILEYLYEEGHANDR